MPDTNRTKAALQALLADNTTADISPQDVRDFLESVFTLATKGDLTGIDAAGLRQALSISGNDGWVLTEDAASPLGWTWAAAGAGAHPNLATHDALGLATDAELTTHTGTADAHHATDHDHDGSPTQKLLAANTHESPSPDTHHAQSHGNGDHTTAFTDDTTVNAHIADGTAAHAASAISADSTTLVGTGTDVQAVLEELDNGIADHLADTTSVHAHSSLGSVGANDHHNQSHAHNGADGSGTVAGSDLTGTPGGELGGTWASPTVDATHSGSAHHNSHDSDDVAYIPASNADWGGSDPGDVEQALDVLADRTSKKVEKYKGAWLIPSFDRAAWVNTPGVNTEPTNDYAWRGQPFSGSAKQYAAGDFSLDDNYDGGTLTYRVRWRHKTGAGTGTVIWGVQMLAVSDGDAGDAAMGTAVEVTDTILDANDYHRTAMSGAVTPAGTAAAGDHIFFEIYRDGTNDTNNSEQWLVEIEFFYGVTAAGVA